MLNTAHLTLCRRRRPFRILCVISPSALHLSQLYSRTEAAFFPHPTLMMAFISVQYGKYSNAFLYTRAQTLFRGISVGSSKESVMEIFPSHSTLEVDHGFYKTILTEQYRAEHSCSSISFRTKQIAAASNLCVPERTLFLKCLFAFYFFLHIPTRSATYSKCLFSIRWGILFSRFAMDKRTGEKLNFQSAPAFFGKCFRGSQVVIPGRRAANLETVIKCGRVGRRNWETFSSAHLLDSHNFYCC